MQHTPQQVAPLSISPLPQLDYKFKMDSCSRIMIGRLGNANVVYDFTKALILCINIICALILHCFTKNLSYLENVLYITF